VKSGMPQQSKKKKWLIKMFDKKLAPYLKSKAYNKYAYGPIENRFSQFCKEQNLHHCMTGEKNNFEIYSGNDSPIVVCYEDEKGILWAGNDVDLNLECVVNFCPFCGYKSKNTIDKIFYD
jgi:hypothetical protein